MKKTLAALLSLTMVLGFTGCTGENSDGMIFDTAFSTKDATLLLTLNKRKL